jgi:non-specific serine/threonine protein kinase
VELAPTLAPYHNKALPAGSLLREWRLEGVLGVGGFGIVYRAKGVYFNETVAIKEYFPGAISDRRDGTTVAPTDSSSEQVYALGLEKFVEEAKVLWSLSKPERHPNIVNVRSLFEVHGTAYMVMDFEEGVALSELLRRGRGFDEAALLDLLRPLAEGLDRAHAGGVLHRDIKPANVLIRETGAPVLIDFGSARFDSGQATSTTVTFYTPPYAALEQYVRTYAQGPWTDIYALGVVLYQCVTGQKPPEVLERLHGGDAQPLSLGDWPGFSRVFTRAVDAAMAIRPADRPQSIREWLELFERPDGARNEELTRVRATLVGSDATRAQAAVTSPAAPRAQPAPKETVDPKVRLPASFRRIRLARVWPWAGAGLSAVAALALGAMLVQTRAERGAGAPRGRAPVVQAPLPSRPAAVAQPTAPTLPMTQHPARLPPGLDAALSALAADANRVGAPAPMLASLSAVRSNIAAEAAQIRTLGAKPEDADRAARLLRSLRDQVASLCRLEVGALSTDAEGRTLEAQRVLGTGAPPGLAATYASVRRSGAALIAASQSSTADAVTLLALGRRLLADFDSFNQAYGEASNQFVPVRRQAFEAIQSRTYALAARTTAAAAVAKPWLFASQSRKQAYQRLQTDASRARVLQAQLTQLSKSAATASSVAALDADILQASAISREMAALGGGTSAASANADGADAAADKP